MKRIYLTGLFMIAGLALTAQSKDTKKADEHFAKLEYVAAAEDYLDIVEDGDATPYVYKRLAKTYFNLNNTQEAERYYAIVVTQDNVEAEDFYNYAQTLKANGKLKEAQQAMQQFAKAAPNDGRAIAFRRNPGYFEDIMAMEPGYTAQKLEFNTELQDFGATLHDGKLYFVSARNRSRKKYGWNEEPTLDIYVVEEMEGAFGVAELLEGDVNSKYHEGTVSITEDGKTMYFTRNNYTDGDYEADEEGINRLKIYSAEWINGEWDNIQPLPFNSDNFSSGHTTLSPDGKTLYFSSDRPGTIGKSDIYKVAINEDGTFGEPENLGNGINTVGRESFPFVAKDGTLYFSSDGHLGIGGLDIFSARTQGNGFGAVENMGTPVNSSNDDFAYTRYKEEKMAFVSSNRGSTEANDNVYLLKPIEKCANDILILVVDADTDQPIKGATAKMYNTKGKFMQAELALPTGKATFTQPCGTYEVQADAEGYFSNSETVTITAEDKEITIKLQLPPEPEITETKVVLEPIFFEFDKADITPEAALELDRLVRVMQEHPEMKIQARAHTDSRGSDSYNLALSDRRAKSTAQYIISQGIDESRISGKGFGETMPKVACGGDCTDEEHALNRRSEFKIVGGDVTETEE